MTTPAALEGTGVPPSQRPNMDPAWAATIKMNLPAFREYAKTVFASTEATIAGMSDAELGAEFDGPFGKMPVASYLTNLALYHTVGHSGEIAALKGVHGLKGLPF